MKVLDPQSVLLTNSEVAAHLADLAKKPQQQKDTGSYSKPNLTGYNTILKDFTRYHTSQTAASTIPTLVKRLKPYNLTKTEVLNLINLNLGAKVEDEVKQEDGEEDEVTSRDLALFRVAVEDADERFPGEEGEERIGEVVRILKGKS